MVAEYIGERRGQDSKILKFRKELPIPPVGACQARKSGAGNAFSLFKGYSREADGRKP
jgi:hypothetical protein